MLALSVFALRVKPALKHPWSLSLLELKPWLLPVLFSDLVFIFPSVKSVASRSYALDLLKE